MVPQRILHLSLRWLLVLLLIGAVAPSAAAPPPRPFCDACGESFEATAESRGVTLTVERSTATVTVHEYGTAAWVVRNHVTDSEGASRLLTNASLREAIADRAMWDTELLGANVSADGVMTMRYREAEFAERSICGALNSGEFTE